MLAASVVEQRHTLPVSPLVILLHFLFKFLAFFLYTTSSSLLSLSFTSAFISVTLVLSVDFWWVKNVSGRKMVGLRYWNEVKANDKGHWVFEKRDKENNNEFVVKEESPMAFWMALTLNQVVWSVLLLSALTHLQPGWMLITIIASTLNGANLIGHIRCRFKSDNSHDNKFNIPGLSHAYSSLRRWLNLQHDGYVPANTQDVDQQ